MKKRLLCLSDLFPAFLYDECPLSPAEVIHSPCRGRANAPETFTRILSFIIMKSVNYPHANLANLAESASLRPRLSALPPTRMSVG